MSDQPTPEPDGLTPAQRHTRLVMQHELLLLETLRQLAGAEFFRDAVRSQRRPNQEDIWDAADRYRRAEGEHDRVKKELITHYKEALALMAQEEQEAEKDV